MTFLLQKIFSVSSSLIHFHSTTQMKLQHSCTLEDYINFHGGNHTQSISRESLHQIIQMHGFQKLHNSPKKVLTDVLNTLDLISPYRSSLTRDVSAYASLTTEDVSNDLDVVQWEKCSLHSIKTFNSPKLLENTTTFESAMDLEEGMFEMKPVILENTATSKSPMDLEEGMFEMKPVILETETIEMKPTILADGTLQVKPTEKGTFEMKPTVMENGMIEMKPRRTRVSQQQKYQGRKKRTIVPSAFDVAAANAVSAFWLSKVDCRLQRSLPLIVLP